MPQNKKSKREWWENRLVDSSLTSSKHLWAGSILFFGVGDTATTFIGLTRSNIAETNEIPSLFISQIGIEGLILLKIITFIAMYLLYRISPKEWKIGVPLGLYTVGVIVTIWNISVILP